MSSAPTYLDIISCTSCDNSQSMLTGGVGSSNTVLKAATAGLSMLNFTSTTPTIPSRLGASAASPRSSTDVCCAFYSIGR